MANSMTTDQLIAELKKRDCTIEVIKPKPLFMRDVKVGDEVEYNCHLGKIVKINKSSVSWAEYEISNTRSIVYGPMQEFKDTKCCYDKSKLMRSKAIKNFHVPTKPDDFIYYTVRQDFGR